MGKTGPSEQRQRDVVTALCCRGCKYRCAGAHVQHVCTHVGMLNKIAAYGLVQVWTQSCRQRGAPEVFVEATVVWVLCFEHGLEAVWRQG